MRNFVGLVMAAALLTVTAAQAASDYAVTPLAAGKPAGLRPAQDGDNNIPMIVGLGAIGIGVALLVSGGNSDKNPPATTPTTS